MEGSGEDRGWNYKNKNTIDYNSKRLNESINASDKRYYCGKIDVDSDFTHLRSRNSRNEDKSNHRMNEDKTPHDEVIKRSYNKKMRLEKAQYELEYLKKQLEIEKMRMELKKYNRLILPTAKIRLRI